MADAIGLAVIIALIAVAAAVSPALWAARRRQAEFERAARRRELAQAERADAESRRWLDKTLRQVERAESPADLDRLPPGQERKDP